MAIVLLVEDEEQVRVLAQSYLDKQGHEVLSAGTPQGAIALLEKAPHVDVLFTDLDLKGDIHAGIELARQATPLASFESALHDRERFDGRNEGPLC